MINTNSCCALFKSTFVIYKFTLYNTCYVWCNHNSATVNLFNFNKLRISVIILFWLIFLRIISTVVKNVLEFFLRCNNYSATTLFFVFKTVNNRNGINYLFCDKFLPTKMKPFHCYSLCYYNITNNDICQSWFWLFWYFFVILLYSFFVKSGFSALLPYLE